ncbi:hypothetical protein H4R34_004930 [Dimargaris verticillata]|uniref:CS domain-containing protein n=1 Tax=Dimargaris verticillata TaxID=2761393 RepID=A0A9W8EAQ0_9FUNG|nr:hypothetical protein H4R34_004930 [Dimargaris verticillata]
MAFPANSDARYTQFEQEHRNQFQAINLPEHLWLKLYTKLSNDQFDAGQLFAFAEEDPSPLSQYALVLKVDSLAKESDVFLVDHAWATTSADPYQQLLSDPQLLERMAAIVRMPVNLSPAPATTTATAAPNACPPQLSEDEWKSLVTTVRTEGKVSESAAQQLLANSNYDLVTAIMSATMPDLGEGETMSQIKRQIMGQMSADAPTPEPRWATTRYRCHQYEAMQDDGTLAGVVEIQTVVGPEVPSRRIQCQIRPHNLSLAVQGLPPILDGTLFAEIDPTESTWTLEHGEVTILLRKKASDQAWPELILGEKRVDQTVYEAQVRQVATALQPYMQTYTYVHFGTNGVPQQGTVWYVMDEVGNAMANSTAPNTACYSFLYCSPTTGAVNAYNVMWPIQDLTQGEKVTRDFRLTRPDTATK